MANYSGALTERITGLTMRQLGYWQDTNFIVPSVSTGEGKGRRRWYSFRDLIALKAAAALRTAEIPLQRIRRVVDYLQTLEGISSPTDALAASVLIVRGSDIIAVRDGISVSTLTAPGTIEIGFTLPIRQLRDELIEDIRKAA